MGIEIRRLVKLRGDEIRRRDDDTREKEAKIDEDGDKEDFCDHLPRVEFLNAENHRERDEGEHADDDDIRDVAEGGPYGLDAALDWHIFVNQTRLS